MRAWYIASGDTSKARRHLAELDRGDEGKERIEQGQQDEDYE